MKLSLHTAVLFFPFVAVGLAHSEEAEGIEFFEEKIRPVLVKHCYECHSVEEGKSKGGLRVDSMRALRQGGDNGPSVVPGDLEASLLITAVQYHDSDYEMPPDGKLPDEIIRDFERWVAMRAPDPRVREAADPEEESQIDLEAGREFWSYRSPGKGNPPAIENPQPNLSPIDRFVIAKREEEGLVSVASARPETLVRRLYFVLCGLPPSVDDVMKWAKALGPDLDQEVLAELIDTLLASPRFGERWGQHWLDVARYADSTGGDSNNIYPNAWRYRDYVIDAFNEDKPFDRFVREQLAGDLLPASSEKEWAKNVVATGFLAVGQKLVGEVDDEKFQYELVDEQIDATTRAFLGTTAACARCHDHKSDPIPQSDYYAMAAIFRNSQTHYGLLDAQARQSSTLLNLTGKGLPSGRPALSPEAFAQLVAERDEARAAMDEVRRMIRSKDEDVSRAKLRRSRTKEDRTAAALEAYDENGNPLTWVMGVEDREEPVETHLLVRGEIDKPGPVVEPGFLQVIGRPAVIGENHSGRLELADWIASPENPLTARVLANRIWHWLFGQGLVRTVDNFCASGELPSHPGLLDYLAVRVVEKEWSVKQVIREILLTQTWQQASTYHSENFERDPDNRLLWRMSPRRLEGEAIRDAFLTVSGNLEVGKPNVPLLDAVGEGTVGQNVVEPEIRAIKSNLRSVYLPRVRNVLPEVLSLFDAPDPSGVTGARETTTVPLQALYTLNNAFAREQAAAFALQVGARPRGEQISFAYLKAFARFPTDREQQIARTFFGRFASLEGDEVTDALTAYCHALLCSAEFQVLD